MINLPRNLTHFRFKGWDAGNRKFISVEIKVLIKNGSVWLDFIHEGVNVNEGCWFQPYYDSRDGWKSEPNSIKEETDKLVEWLETIKTKLHEKYTQHSNTL